MAVLLIPQPSSPGAPTLEVDQDGNYVIRADLSVIGDLVVSGTINFDSGTLSFPLPIALGGTGGATADAARTALGLAIGTNVQAWSANLDAWSAVNPSGYYTTSQANATFQPLSENLTAWAALATSAKQDASGNLTTLAGITPGAAGQAILADATVTDVLDYLGITELKFATKAAAISASPLTKFIRIFGIATEGDYGGIDAQYVFTASTPSHDHYITCANGRKYVRVPPPAGVPCNVAEIGLLPNRGSGVDCTPDLNKVFAAALNSNCKFWKFPEVHTGVTGHEYYFNTKPNAMPPMTLHGPGMKTTLSLFKNFVSANPYDGIFNIHISNTYLKGLRIVGVSGSQNPAASNAGTGCAISIIANTSDGAIGYCGLDEIEVTSDASLPNGHGCLAYDIYADGTATSLVGVRAIPMTRLKLFGAELGSFYLRGHVGALITMEGAYGAGGLSGKMIFTGIAGKAGDGTSLTSGELLGGLDVDFQNGFTANIGLFDADLVIGSNCTGVTINGSMSFAGTVTNNGGTDCKVTDLLLDTEYFTWTPTLSFLTAGDLSVTYNTRIGRGVRRGKSVRVDWHVQTSAFTHTTAGSSMIISGLPTAASILVASIGNMLWGGITKANYTQIMPRLASGATQMDFVASGSGQAPGTVSSANVPTGGTVWLQGNIEYEIA